MYSKTVRAHSASYNSQWMGMETVMGVVGHQESLMVVGMRKGASQLVRALLIPYSKDLVHS